MVRAPLLLAAIAITLYPHSTQAQKPATTPKAACPLPSPTAGRVAMKPFQQKRLTWFRRQYRLNGVDYRAIKPLRGATDADACSRLDEVFGVFATQPQLARSYYRVGRYYLVAVVDLTDPKVALPLAGRLYVADRNFRVFATIAPRLDL